MKDFTYFVKFQLYIYLLFATPYLICCLERPSLRSRKFSFYAPFNGCDIQGAAKRKIENCLWTANPISYTSAKFDPEDLDDDEELEKTMAEDLYNGLKGESNLLPVLKFYEWDDIKDVLSRGFVDTETLQIILAEAGVVDGLMTFEQFYEVVDLVNQVSMRLEEVGNFAAYDIDDEEEEEEEEMRLDKREFFGL